MSKDFITPDELQALLGTDEVKVDESKTMSGVKPELETVPIPELQKKSALESEQLLELRNTISELADRVTHLELLLAEEIEARLQWSSEHRAVKEAAALLEAELLNHPEPGTFSRSESYGKKTNKKKKKSLWQKLIE